MIPGSDVNWSDDVDLWGPRNPLKPGKTWGPVHVFYAMMFVLLASVVPLMIFIVISPAVQASFTGAEGQSSAALEGLITNPAFLALSLGCLWAVFVGYPLWVSRRRGSRSIRADFGWAFNWKTDILGGFVLAAALRLAEAALMFGATTAGLNLEGADNSSFLNDPTRMWYWTAFLILGVAVGAPLTEELFFRGFALRAFMRGKHVSPRKIWGVRVSTIVAVVGSSVLFGVLHASAFNTGGLFLIGVTSSLGMTFAIAAVLLGRIGLGVLTHVVFNASAVVAILVPVTAPWLLPVAGVVVVAGGAVLYVMARRGVDFRLPEDKPPVAPPSVIPGVPVTAIK